MIKRCYPEGKEKAFTLSYDDGVYQDRKLVEIFNRYGVRATFNLNSGIQNEKGTWYAGETRISRMRREEIGSLYDGHEIAVHTLTHPHLESLAPEQIEKEVSGDKKALEAFAHYEIKGMAYPFGTFNDQVTRILEKCGIVYARTVEEHHDFRVCEDYLRLSSTCHHDYEGLFELADAFLTTDKELALFYVWGHSYEFDLHNNWNRIEKLCEQVSRKEDVWYATNIDALTYARASKKLVITETSVSNPTDMPLWVKRDKDGKVFKVPQGKTVFIEDQARDTK